MIIIILPKSILFIIWFKNGYQWQRILNWINPNEGLQEGNYQSSQAIIGLGNGGLWGQGIGNSVIKFPGLLPEVQTDFIFFKIKIEFSAININFCDKLSFLSLCWLSSKCPNV